MVSIYDVLRRTGEIHRAKARVDARTREAAKKWAFVAQGGNAASMIVELKKEEGGFYSITSAYPMDKADAASRYSPRTLLARIPLRAAASGQVGPPVTSRLSSESGNHDGSGLGVRQVREKENTPLGDDVNGPVRFSRSGFQQAHMADAKEPASLWDKVKSFDVQGAADTARLLFTDKTAPAQRLAKMAAGKSGAEGFGQQARRRARLTALSTICFMKTAPGVLRSGISGRRL